MTCLNGKCYLPQPPREWSRVQRSWSQVNENTNNEFVNVPYTNKSVPFSILSAELAMINKGNVLQYKSNSSNLTKNQRYSLIAKGQWTNRTKTWASQSTRGYTNPNTQSLARVGATNVTLSGVETGLPITCPSNIIQKNQMLPSVVPGTNNPIIPPPVPPSPTSGTDIPIVFIPEIIPIIIQDFGNLVCGTRENLCTGEIITSIKLDNCHPTTDSNVPGPIQDLCWNDGNPTWYPRQQYVMTNSGDKWPVNAQLLSAVKPATPILSIIVETNVAILLWTTNDSCLPITSYNVFKNNILLVNTVNTSYTVDITNKTDTFYVTSLSGNISSHASNIVSLV